MIRRLPRLLVVAALVAASVAASPAAARHFACEKFVLPNGMTVILHEDHSVPLVTVNTWYGVGSKDEDPGRSGFAHLFEHLMFMGTERVPGSDFDVLMENGGGHNNATTSSDRTNYFSVGPSQLLPTLLWLDADRLESLGRAMTQEKLDLQRDVVRNERRQSIENAPYEKANTALDEFIFPEGHPYHISVIGRHEDLQAATLFDVVSFFNRYYVPANASLVIAGDFDPKVVRPLVEKLFGTIPARPLPSRRTAAPVTLAGVQRLTFEDQVQLPRTTMTWLSPSRFAPGDAELDLLAMILAGTESSRLHRVLVRETGRCVDVSAAQYSAELQSTFRVEATCDPAASIDDIEATIDGVIAELRAKGPTDEEVSRARAALERQLLRQAEKLQQRADMLNAYQHFLGEPDSLARDLDRYRRATARDVREWSKKVLDPGARVVMRVVPATPNPRDVRPAAFPSAGYAFPKPETFQLAGGLTVHHWNRPELPLVGVRLLVPGGAALDGPGQAGLANLLLAMLTEGTTARDAATFAGELDALGAEIQTEVKREAATVSMTSLPRSLSGALELLAEAVTSPRLAEDDFSRVRARIVQERVQAEDDPMQVAAAVATGVLFGDDHPFGRPLRGTSATVATLSLDAIRQLHAGAVRPDRAVLLIAGPVTREAVQTALAAGPFARWAAPPTPPAAVPAIAPSRTGDLRAYLVHRPDAVQTVARFAWAGPGFASPDRAALETAMTILGGSFTSRLNRNLREVHGYTYGASARTALEPSTGFQVAGAAVRTDVTGAALAEFLREFDRMGAEPFGEPEIAKAVATTRRSIVEAAQGASGLLDAAERLVANDRPMEDFDRWLAALDAVTGPVAVDAARRLVTPRRGVLVLVGDRERILPQLSGLGLPAPLELDARGAPIN